MAKVLLDQFIKTIAVEFENTPKEVVETLGITRELPKDVDKAFGAIYTDEIKKGLTRVATLLGIEYKGCSFKFWLGKSDRYVAAGPSIYNDGQGPVVEWGDEISKLSGDIHGTPVGSALKIKTGEDPNYRMTIGVSLQHDGTEEGRKQAEGNWEDCDTWEEATRFLKLRLRMPPREEVFSKDRQLSIIAAELKEKDGKSFWIVNCTEEELGMFQIFLPDESNPYPGTKIKVLAEQKCYEIRGEKFYSAAYLSLGQLDVGEVVTVERIEKDRKYGRWNLHSDKGIITANAQFNRWYEKEGFPVIGENGFGKIILTILKIDKQPNRSIVLLDIKVEGRERQGLAALLSKRPIKQTPPPKSWDEDEEEDVVEPVSMGLDKLVGKSTESPAVEEDDDWM